MSIDRISGEFFHNGEELVKSEQCNFEFSNDDFQLYEVMRTKNGRLIFEKDHLARLEKGLHHLGFTQEFPETEIGEQLKTLVQANKCASGNIKLYASWKGGELKHTAAYIPHYYPADKLYHQGVQLKSFQIERTRPEIKQVAVSSEIQANVKRLMRKGIFEVLLVDKEGYITEGSKSNFFLVKNNALYSAPEHDVLAGITRKYVLEIASKLNIPIRLQKIAIAEIKEFEAAFICGTSPRVLPVNRIDFLSFNPEHPKVRQLMEAYNALLDLQSRE